MKLENTFGSIFLATKFTLFPLITMAALRIFVQKVFDANLGTRRSMNEFISTFKTMILKSRHHMKIVVQFDLRFWLHL